MILNRLGVASLVETGTENLAPAGDALRRLLVAQIMTELFQLLPGALPCQVSESSLGAAHPGAERPTAGRAEPLPGAAPGCQPGGRRGPRLVPMPAGQPGSIPGAQSAPAHGGSGLGSPPGNAGVAVGGVANQRQPVRDGLGAHAELLEHTGFVEHDVAPAIPGRRPGCPTPAAPDPCPASR